jgi:ribonuclease-3
MTPLETGLGYRFKASETLAAALVHRSYAAEQPSVESNERMEFLGDAVLQMVTTEYIYQQFPLLPEGQMAKVRAACVNRGELAEVAAEVGLGNHLMLGKSENTVAGRLKESILADAMEAVLAAVYLDGGWEAASRVILHHWTERIRTKAEAPGRLDFKTRLQEILAAEGKGPTYATTSFGPDHSKFFAASVSVDNRQIGEGRGASKKTAEQDAARAALEALGKI